MSGDARLEIRAVHVLRGPNVWSNSPVIEAWVDLKELKDSASSELAGFNERLMGWLPSMIEHRCSVGKRGGFFERLRRGTYPAHVLEHVCLELQSLAGTPVGFGRARAMAEDGVYRVVVAYRDEALGRAALGEARALLLAAIDGRDFDVTGVVKRLLDLAGEASRDRSLEAIRQAARTRSIPMIELARNGLVQLGQGARQRRFHRGLTDATGAVAEETASDRAFYRPFLRAAGIPLPRAVPVETGEQAVEVLAELGAPVVVKPLQRDCGPGISAPLTQGKDVHGAYAAARSVSRHVVVERHVPGDAIRVLVVGGEVAGAVRVIDVNDPESRTVDVTGRLHPDTKAAAAEAARLVGLDLAEVLLGARDVALPLAEQGGVVRAVVARPSLAPYASSACVTPLPVADAVLRYLFPNGGDGRIPLVGVTGGPERVEVARLLAQVLERSFPGLGLAAEGSVTVNGRSWRPSGGGAFEAARALLVHPEVTAGIVEVGRRDVLVEGLGFDRCGVAIVAGLDDGAELPITDWGFEEPAENLPRAERCLVDVVLAGGWVVLNGDERRLEPFVEHVPAGARLIVVATDAGNPLVARQVAARERTIVLERGQAVFREGQSTLAVVGIDAAGRAAAPVLAALGGGWAMGLSPVELGAWILERR